MATKQEKRYASLVKRGYFLSECRVFSGFDFREAPWWPKLRKDRTKLVKIWAKKKHVDLSTIDPLTLRKSLSYQLLVRKWYADNGWVKERKRYGRVTYRIDPYGAMRYYADHYEKIAEEKPYMPPWRKREKTRRERVSAIDKRFNAALGISIL